MKVKLLVLFILLATIVLPVNAQNKIDTSHWCWTENYHPAKCVPLFTPIEYPDSLDDLYRLVEGQGNGWYFDKKCIEGVPQLTWTQARKIFALMEDDGDTGRIIISKLHLAQVIPGVLPFGYLNITEDELMKTLLLQLGDFTLCGDGNGYPIMQGDGVLEIIEFLNKS